MDEPQELSPIDQALAALVSVYERCIEAAEESETPAAEAYRQCALWAESARKQIIGSPGIELPPSSSN